MNGHPCENNDNERCPDLRIATSDWCDGCKAALNNTTADDHRRALEEVEGAYPRDVFPWPPPEGTAPTNEEIAGEMARRTIANIREVAIRLSLEDTT